MLLFVIHGGSIMKKCFILWLVLSFFSCDPNPDPIDQNDGGDDIVEEKPEVTVEKDPSAILPVENNPEENDPFDYAMIDTEIDDLSCIEIRYVSPNGDDSKSGSADFPFLTIQAAIDSLDVFETEKRRQVRMATGTYELTESLIMKSGVSVRGGYSSLDWTRYDISSFQARNTNMTKVTSIASFSDPTLVLFSDDLDGDDISENPIGRDVVLEGITFDSCSLAIEILIYLPGQERCNPIIEENTFIGDNTGVAIYGDKASYPHIRLNYFHYTSGTLFSTQKSIYLTPERTSSTLSVGEINVQISNNQFIGSCLVEDHNGVASVIIDTNNIPFLIKDNYFNMKFQNGRYIYFSVSNKDNSPHKITGNKLILSDYSDIGGINLIEIHDRSDQIGTGSISIFNNLAVTKNAEFSNSSDEPDDYLFMFIYMNIVNHSQVLIYNNTVCFEIGRSGILKMIYGSSETAHAQIFNNIFYSDNLSIFMKTIDIPANDTFTHNAFFSNFGTDAILDDNANDSNYLILPTDDLFVDTSTADYTLKDTVPLVIKNGALDYRTALIKDLSGNERTGNGTVGWSMGCFELD